MARIVILLCVLLLISVYMDMRSNKIPNRLIVTGMILGILSITSLDMLRARTLQVLIVFLLLFPFFSIGALGAGDIKCICMVGLYLDTKLFKNSIIYCFIIAAVFSFCKMLHSCILKEKIGHFLNYLRHCYLCRNIFPYETENTNTNTTIHLALPILLGVLTSIGGTCL